MFRRWLPLILLFATFLLQWALLMNISGPTWDAAFYYARVSDELLAQKEVAS